MYLQEEKKKKTDALVESKAGCQNGRGALKNPVSIRLGICIHR